MAFVSPSLPYSTLPVARSRVMPARVAYPLILIAAGILVTAGQAVSSGLGPFLEGRRNADPPFILSKIDLCCFVSWFTAVAGMLLILLFTQQGPRVVAGILLATCALAITPLQCASRQMPLGRYEAGFLQWASAHVAVAPIVAWQSTLPPVTVPTNVPAAAWPAAVALLKPSNVIQDPGGIILEWGMVGRLGTSRRVFIGANGTVSPPANDENVLFNWKTLGPGFFAAYQATD